MAILLILTFSLSLPAMAFEESKALTVGDYQYKVDGEGTAVITRYLGLERNPVIPAELIGLMVTEISDGAFRDCDFIEKAVIPEGIMTIGPLAFYNCTSLREVSLPAGLLSIGEFAFAYCANLTAVSLPDSLQTVGEDAFFAAHPNLTIFANSGTAACDYADLQGIACASPAELPPVLSVDRPEDSSAVIYADDEPEQIAAVFIAPDPSPYHTLRLGDRGEEVKKLRDRLYELGYYLKLYDHSNYTEGTKELVAVFQRNNKLRPSGVATPETQALMYSEFAIPKQRP